MQKTDLGFFLGENWMLTFAYLRNYPYLVITNGVTPVFWRFWKTWSATAFSGRRFFNLLSIFNIRYLTVFEYHIDVILEEKSGLSFRFAVRIGYDR